MARTMLSSTRKHDFEEPNIGQIIIFCEGETEEYYFDYFAEIIRNKYNHIIVETQTVGSDAQAVLDYADKFIGDVNNNRKYKDCDKYLVFDCDAPTNIQEIVNKTRGSDYILLVTNYSFETWLLMYFEEVNVARKNFATIQELEKFLHDERYKKGSKGKVREIIQNGDFERASDNADRLMKTYSDSGLTIYSDIDKMNPYTNVHELVKQFMVVLSPNSR